ncbi:hypothetical protein [Nostoc sp. DedSLP04]|nr:hypothetical protein [Nostoc sp. DedSLP04]MDZ8033604.1 hypothetical protein [Nostoc sp. DedSLP04]
MGTKRVESTSIEVFMGDRNPKKYRVNLIAIAITAILLQSKF